MVQIAVLTTTFYKSTDETRFHLAAQMIGNAIAVGHSVIVVDGSPDDAIGESLRRLGARVFKQTAQGMGASRRELFTLAGDPQTYGSSAALPSYFIWLEPEKVDLVRWIPEIIDPIRRGGADIVIPARTEEGYASCPAFQAKSERQANVVYADATGKDFDVMFGPVAYNLATHGFFATCNPKERYGAHDTYIQHVAPLEAMADGYSVVSVPVGFLYPPAQKAEEEAVLSDAMRAKRRLQLDECTHAFRVVAGVLKLKPESR